MILVVGTIMHVVLGVGLRIFLGWRFGIVAAVFAAKEIGELKYKIPGSIMTFEKNFRMWEELLFDPSVVAQWLIPAIAASAVGYWLARKNALVK